MRRETGTFHVPPAGLREAVLQVSLESPWEHRRRTSSPLLAVVRAWWRGETCSAADWVELQRLCGVPEDRLGSRYIARQRAPVNGQ